tara:strand:- start:1357 stop:1632 length:276 start_codon:yes stop_codon:yes gene_type:complete
MSTLVARRNGMKLAGVKDWVALWSTNQHGDPFKPYVNLSSMVDKKSYPYKYLRYRLVGRYDKMIEAQEACMEAVYVDGRGYNRWRKELEFF